LTGAESGLVFDRVEKRFGAGPGAVAAVAPFSATVARGEVAAFLGPSGCGKTTLMRMAGGLETPSAGEIRLDGARLGAPDRRRGMVFQAYSSFPWLTVEGNVLFGMRYRRDLTPGEKRGRARRYVEMVGLSAFADAYPARLSGGMRQRVAIARTLAAGSEVLLMDEPFGALDAMLRETLQVELRRLQEAEPRTVIFVTHDVEEAAFVADRVIVFTRRPARVLAEVDVRARLGDRRPLALRDSPEFFALRGEILRHVRATAAEETA
jgi:NitT/TauT family transport system ATP-binding protein